MELQNDFETPSALPECEDTLPAVKDDLFTDTPNSDTEDDSEFPSSELSDSSLLSAADVIDFRSPPIRREMSRELFQLSSTLAKNLLDKYRQNKPEILC